MNTKKKHSTPRRKAREVAFQILYRYDVAEKADGTRPPEGAALAEELVSHFEHFKVPEEAREFAAQLVSGTLMDREKLDRLISERSRDWKLERMGVVDRNLLRMGAHELLHFQDIPAAVTLNELVDLSKIFGSADTPAFINGILDGIGRSAGDS